MLWGTWTHTHARLKAKVRTTCRHNPPHCPIGRSGAFVDWRKSEGRETKIWIWKKNWILKDKFSSLFSLKNKEIENTFIFLCVLMAIHDKNYLLEIERRWRPCARCLDNLTDRESACRGLFFYRKIGFPTPPPTHDFFDVVTRRRHDFHERPTPTCRDECVGWMEKERKQQIEKLCYLFTFNHH